jgi:Predicted translation initiation factor 2B subunit, eIF-2B alpha/beta/delta family
MEKTKKYAIRNMVVRGAPLIGVVGAFGLAFELSKGDPGPEAARAAAERLSSARPTAVNLPRAVGRVLEAYLERGARGALEEARSIMEYEREAGAHDRGPRREAPGGRRHGADALQRGRAGHRRVRDRARPTEGRGRGGARG